MNHKQLNLFFQSEIQDDDDDGNPPNLMIYMILLLLLLSGSVGSSTYGNNSKPLPRSRSCCPFSSLSLRLLLLLQCLLCCVSAVVTAPLGVSIAAISINDVATEIEDIAAIHNNRPFAVMAELVWEEDDEIISDNFYNMNATTGEMVWTMSVDNVVQDSGKVTLDSLLEVRIVGVWCSVEECAILCAALLCVSFTCD
jgi:hypothetical protein